MNVSFINQENEKLTKIEMRIDSHKNLGKLMAAEFPSVVFLLILN